MKKVRNLLLGTGAAALLAATGPGMAQQAEDHNVHHADPAAAGPAAAAPAKPEEGRGQSDRAARSDDRADRPDAQAMMARMNQMMGMMSRMMSQQPGGQQSGTGQQDGHEMQSMQMADQGPASAAFAAINRQMHAGMTYELSGDADVDFVKGMIPHHQAAVDMAKVVMAFGKDPAIHRMAEDVVKAQESEIAMMKEWLAKRGR